MQLTQLTPSISAKNPSIFKFGQNEIRVFERNNEPWFVATDIAKCLGLSNPTKATASLRDSERSNLKLERGGYLVIVSESGLYTMILRSDSAIKEGTPAFKFRVWVTDDLLPELRKNGQYRIEKAEITTLTPAQQLAIQQAVGRRAQKTANHYQTIYRAIKLRYQIARYDQLPESQFEDCLKFIDTVDLHIPEPMEEQQPAPLNVSPKNHPLMTISFSEMYAALILYQTLRDPDLVKYLNILKDVLKSSKSVYWGRYIGLLTELELSLNTMERLFIRNRVQYK